MVLGMCLPWLIGLESVPGWGEGWFGGGVGGRDMDQACYKDNERLPLQVLNNPPSSSSPLLSQREVSFHTSGRRALVEGHRGFLPPCTEKYH